MQRPQNHSAPVAPEATAAGLLRELNIFPTKLAQLADVPVEVVVAAIAHARSRPDLQDLAGYVVRSLEAWRHGWRIPAPLPASGAVDLEKYTSGRYAALFTRDAPAAAGPTAAPAHEVQAAAPAPAPAAPLAQPERQAAANPGRQPATRPARQAGADAARPVASPAAPAQPEQQTLAERLRSELARRAGPRLAPLVAQLQIVLREDLIILGCASRAQAATVSAELQPLLHGCLGSLGLRAPLRSLVLVRGAGAGS